MKSTEDQYERFPIKAGWNANTALSDTGWTDERIPNRREDNPWESKEIR